MAVLEILKFPDPRLRKKCTPITQITPELVRLSEDILDTMYAFHGLGLSAIQVNHFVRLFTADTRSIYDTGEEKPDTTKAHQQAIPNQDINKTNPRYEATQPGEYEQKVKQPLILFNPKIIKREGHTVFNEGCLSFPSYYAQVPRAEIIEVEGLDTAGHKKTIITDGLLSICIQHEIDHLNGKLFIDYLSPIKSQRLISQIKKHGYPAVQPVGSSSKVGL